MYLYFYKDCGATVNSAVIKKLEEDDYGDLTEYRNKGVVGGVAKFKMDNMKGYYPQILPECMG